MNEARSARNEGETWQVGSNFYTKRNGKIVKAADPAKKAQTKPPTKKDQKAQAGAAKADNKAKAMAAAAKLRQRRQLSADARRREAPGRSPASATLTTDEMKKVAKAIQQSWCQAPKVELAKRLADYARKLVSGEAKRSEAPHSLAKPSRALGRTRDRACGT